MWELFLELMRAIFNRNDSITPMTTPITPEAPVVPPKPVIAPVPLLTTFCLAIKQHEGFYMPGELAEYPEGTPSYRNNNPGNCKFSPVGYLPIYEPVKESASGFAIFKDYATGWLYLQNLVKEKISANPNETILQFFENYAPVSDGNNPPVYSADVAAACKLTINTKVGVVLAQ